MSLPLQKKKQTGQRWEQKGNLKPCSASHRPAVRGKEKYTSRLRTFLSWPIRDHGFLAPSRHSFCRQEIVNFRRKKGKLEWPVPTSGKNSGLISFLFVPACKRWDDSATMSNPVNRIYLNLFEIFRIGDRNCQRIVSNGSEQILESLVASFSRNRARNWSPRNFTIDLFGNRTRSGNTT